MERSRKRHIDALNSDRCWHCEKKMTEEELSKVVGGISVEKYPDGTVGCADCMLDIYSGN